MLMKNIMETYLKTNNEIKDDENKSDTKSYDDKIIETNPVLQIESYEEDSINSNESKSKEDENTDL